MSRRSPVPVEFVGLLAFVVIAAVYTYLGWRCFTGRSVFWLRRRTFIDAWWPAGVFIGGALLVFSVGVLATYLLEQVVAPQAAAQQPLRVIAGVGLGVGIPAMVFLVVALGSLMWIEETFRRRPNGTWLARLLLPRWYREELRRRTGTKETGRGGAR
jgi:hypothetical protein